MARKPDPGARERILDVATRLFDAHGVHAVGLQQLIDELGCGKNLLYREFAGKDDLVVAYLARCREGWADIVDGAGAGRADDPAGHLVAIVEKTAERVASRDFRGCPIYKTYAEFPDRAHPAHRVAEEHFAQMHAQLLELATRAGVADPRGLADRLLLIIEGLNTGVAALRARGGPPPAANAVPFAAEVVRSALAK